ncbi:hypothetical protein [Pseudogemmobacter sonorensis]
MAPDAAAKMAAKMAIDPEAMRATAEEASELLNRHRPLILCQLV